MRRPARAFIAAVMAVAICPLASAAGAGTRHAAGKGRIEVAAKWSGAERNRFQDVLDAFTEKTGIDVTYTSTGDDIAAVLEPRIAADDTPDVALIPQPGLLEEFARAAARWCPSRRSPVQPSRRATPPSGESSEPSTARSTPSGSRARTSPWSGTTTASTRKRACARGLVRRSAREPGDAGGLRRGGAGRRCRRRMDAHRHLRERLPRAGGSRRVRAPGPPRDPVDRPERQDRPALDGPDHPPEPSRRWPERGAADEVHRLDPTGLRARRRGCDPHRG